MIQEAVDLIVKTLQAALATFQLVPMNGAACGTMSRVGVTSRGFRVADTNNPRPDPPRPENIRRNVVRLLSCLGCHGAVTTLFTAKAMSEANSFLQNTERTLTQSWEWPFSNDARQNDVLCWLFELWSRDASACKQFARQFLALAVARCAAIEALRKSVDTGTNTAATITAWPADHDVVYENPVQTGVLSVVRPINDVFDFEMKSGGHRRSADDGDDQPSCTKDYDSSVNTGRLGA